MSTIHDLAEAVLRVVSKNEIALDEKPGSNDPCKLRFGAWPSTGTRYLGAITFDVLSGDPASPHRAEKGIVAFKRSVQGNGGEVEVLLQRPHTDDDANMVHVATLTSDSLWLKYAPSTQGAPAPARVTRFYSDDGRYCFNVQGDHGGHIVQYEITGADESQWTPVAEWTGGR